MKISSIVFFVLLSSFLFISCKEGKDHATNTSESNQDKTVVIADKKGNTTSFKKNLKYGTLTYKVSSTNDKNNQLTIDIKGLGTEYKEKFEIDAIVEDAIVLDMNRDNYSELYVLLSKNDGSGNKDIMAIASNRDKSASQVAVNKIHTKMKSNTDKFIFDGTTIKRSFIDENDKTTEVSYVLVPGESSYRLIPNMRHIN